MKALKQLLSALLVTAAASTMIVACSSEDSCSIDGDCETGQVCENDVCVDTCASDADCAAGETCAARASGDGLVCQGGANNTNNMNNMNNMNNTNNSNNAVSYNFIMVADTTTGDGCTERDPGSDLQFVRITDFNGTATLGYAEVTTPEFGPEENDFIDTGILDGNPPAFDGDCTDDFQDTSVVAMGCLGTFIMRPLDGTLQPLVLNAGEHAIEVGEYGVECGGSAADSYEVFGCEDGVTAGMGDVAGCTISFGTGSGVTLNEVL